AHFGGTELLRIEVHVNRVERLRKSVDAAYDRLRHHCLDLGPQIQREFDVLIAGDAVHGERIAARIAQRQIQAAPRLQADERNAVQIVRQVLGEAHDDFARRIAQANETRRYDDVVFDGRVGNVKHA